MPLNKLSFMVDTVGNNSFVRNPPRMIVNLVLKPGKPTLFVTPADTGAVLFSANGEFWINPNGTARVPEAAHTDSGSELSPMGYQVGADARLSIVAPKETRLSIAVYST